jgi:REP element-mobilizing transposase RayT
MTYEPRIHDRRTIRLSGWDYSAGGAYFVTLCTDRRAQLFGDIVDGHMRLDAVGTIVADSWRWLTSQYPYVTLDEWCIMPNHLHGILVLAGRGGSRTAPTGDETLVAMSDGGDTATTRKTVGRLIGAFKTVSTKQINRMRHTPGTVVWQRNFWEHIVRDDGEIDRIRIYIRDNEVNLASDDMNDG